MLTLRALPAGPVAGNSLLAAYHDGLRRHWTGRSLMIARWLGRTGQGGWSSAERHSLDEDVRRHGLSMRDRKGVHRLLNAGAFPLAANPLKNKQLFAVRLRDAGLPGAATYDPRAGALVAWLAGQDAIIAKPSYRSKGRGVERFTRDGEVWLDGGGRRIGPAALAAHCARLWRRGGVVQRCLPTHDALAALSPGALPTLRIVTCLDEQGDVEPCITLLRLSMDGGRPVDNFNAGNLVTAVDARGRCGMAWSMAGGALLRHERHPVTGAAIVGQPVPDHGAAIALACAAHRYFRDGFTVIGWDIGLTPDGPALVEGNWNPGTDIVQLVSGQGVGNSRLGALYRHHLARLPAARWRAAGAIEREPRRA